MARPFTSATSLALLATLAVAAPACGSGSAVVGSEVEPGVIYLGHRQVSFDVDHDAIEVGHYQGRFRALRIRVTDAPLDMYDLRVHFANGSVWSPETRVVFGRGQWTRRIELPGDERVIRRIEFLYRSRLHRAGSAHVNIYGIR